MTAAVKDNDGSGKKRKEIPSGEAFHDIGNGKALPSSIPSSSLGRVLSVLSVLPLSFSLLLFPRYGDRQGR